MNRGQVPAHMIVGARTGFLTGMRAENPTWRRVANEVTIDGKYADLVDLGGAPMPTKSKTGMTVQDMIEKTLQIRPADWDITVGISYNAVQDDRTGSLLTRAQQAGGNFNRHINQLVFQAINGGETVGDYGTCYDGLSLFNDAHIDNGAAYQTAQDNKNALSLTPANFKTVYVAASQRLDDQGNQTGFVPDLLIVPPALDYDAAQITGNPKTASTSYTEGEINPYAGRISHIVSPYLDSTAWVMLDSTMPIKPVMVVMRERPFLQEAWFDPAQPDGGWYYFKFFARYNIAFGEWRLITMGNT